MQVPTYVLGHAEHTALTAAYDDGVLHHDRDERALAEDIGPHCPGLREALRAFADTPPPARRLLLLRNLPHKHVDGVASPADRRNPERADTRTEANLRLCAALIGARLRAAAGEAFPFDTPFHHVVPQREHADTPAVNNGAGDFPFHQDRIFLDHPPQFHLLAGVRLGNDPCPTAYVPAAALLQNIPDTVRKALRAAKYVDPHTGKRVPVLRDDEDGEYIGVDLQPGWMLPDDEDSAAALDWLRARSQRLSDSDVCQVLIGPGDLLVHDHRRMLHGRERFTPDFTAPQALRWMIRAHAVR